ncbi:MAG: aldo/keto reductase [Gemmatimonadaceae bacterium]|jgi:aryl-alcohol dehydrogenase-like predicted oxidoreductase|nr:aldo/keto reductase [Gemmatimonadaceae bacterium]
MSVERITLAPGLSISRALTGLWQIADMERDGRTVDPTVAARAMHAYVAAGLTTFDMADHYGSAEVIAGTYGTQYGATGVQRLTKWVPTPGPVSRESVVQAVDRACARLATDRVDLLQFHAWRWSDPSWLDALFFLDELRQAGRIGAIGVTNFDAVHLRMALATGIPIVSNQLSFSLIDRRALGPMQAVCAHYGVKLLAYGTLAGGLLSEKWLGQPAPTSLETWSQMKYRRFIDAAGGWDGYQRVLRALHDVATRLGVSMATVASRWVLEQPHVGGVIIGARLGERAHLDDTLRLFDIALDAQAHASLAEATAALAPIPGDCGDEYRTPPYLTASGDLSHHVASFPAPYTVRQDADGRRRALSGTPWEEYAGYCRAVRVGDRIVVSGTTATHGSRCIGGEDAASQAHFVLDKLQGAIESLGGRIEDVIRTRVFVARMEDWEPVARAHGVKFGAIQPANTLVQAALIGEEYRVEIEAEAVVG